MHSGGRGRWISVGSRPAWSSNLSSRTARATHRNPVSKRKKKIQMFIALTKMDIII